MMTRWRLFTAPLAFFFTVFSFAQGEDTSPRQTQSLNGSAWQFVGYKDATKPPDIGTEALRQAPWTTVEVPHDFQTRAAYATLTRGWYRRSVTVDPSAQGKELYLVFEGAATIADVYVNDQHLGQHRGAYTRFVFDATRALHAGADNQLAVLVDDSQEDTTDCLPCSQAGLYKVWGGLYRNVWLVATSSVHIDPTNFAAPGVYLTPKDVSEKSAGLAIRVLLRNTSTIDAKAEVRARVLDPDGKEVKTLIAPAPLPAGGRSTVELSTTIDRPQLWGALMGRLYHVETNVAVNGQIVDAVTQTTGFRWLEWLTMDGKTGGTVTLNGKRIILYGANLHQEVETKGSAVSPQDLQGNFDIIKDLGLNFLRFAHYPHAALEYDLCDRDGVLAWAENGHSSGKDIVTPTAAQITTEMVKQNYNHPSIVVWSVGNEANAAVADACVPVAKSLDPTRPVGVANMRSELADFHTKHCYFGWYHADLDGFKPIGFVSEVGAGGSVTAHRDYADCDWIANRYEPEEYQQIFSENNFQKVFHGDNGQLGLFCVWCLRDFSDEKYKAPVGLNSKGLLTYAGDKKDIYYLYRSFLRPDEPTLWIASKRYFLRRGAADNGIKVYSNAAKVSLTLNGKSISTLDNGHYVIPNGPWLLHVDKKKTRNGEPGPPPPPPRTYVPEKIDNVFFWPVALATGKNVVTVSDDRGRTDTATIYFYGKDGLPGSSREPLPISGLTSSNAANAAYHMDMPVHGQWPIYYDLDSTADNSWNAIPPEIEGATWIALRRVTKPDPVDPKAKSASKAKAPEPNLATDISFTTTRPVKVYVMATRKEAPPSFASGGRFTEVPSGDTIWRDNALILVPTQLYVHNAAAGEKITLALGDRDAIVMVKE